MTDTPTRQYLPELDGVRAFAVVAVVAYHAESVSGGALRFGGGFLGVSVFFTLSGFLIGSQLMREHERNGRIDFAGFTRRRVARLVPAALATIAVVIGLSRTEAAAWGVPDGFAPADAAAAVWNVTNWHLIALPEARLFRLFHPLTHFWSLAVEAQLYLALALAAWAVGRRPLRRRLLVIGAVGWIASTTVAVVVDGSLRREEFGTDIRLAEFAAGVLLAVALPTVRRLAAPRRPLVDVAGVASMVAFVALVLFTSRDDSWLATGGYALLSLLWLAWLVAALEGRLLPRFLTPRPLVWLGTISYSLYLVHWPIVLMLKDDRLGTGPWTGFAVRVGVSLLVGFAVHVAVERPLRRTVATHATSRVLATWFAAAATVTLLGAVLLSG